MTDKLRAAAEAALEALERSRAYVYETDRQQVDDAMDGLRVVLAEQEVPKVGFGNMEPVALETVYETIIHWDVGGGKRSRRELARRIVALYTAPPRREWQSLTDEEIEDLYFDGFSLSKLNEFARAIEAALKEKNK